MENYLQVIKNVSKVEASFRNNREKCTKYLKLLVENLHTIAAESSELTAIPDGVVFETVQTEMVRNSDEGMVRRQFLLRRTGGALLLFPSTTGEIVVGVTPFEFIAPNEKPECSFIKLFALKPDEYQNTGATIDRLIFVFTNYLIDNYPSHCI